MQGVDGVFYRQRCGCCSVMSFRAQPFMNVRGTFNVMEACAKAGGSDLFIPHRICLWRCPQ